MTDRPDQFANVHLVMVAYNQPQLTNLCIASLRRALVASGVTHVWLVDNGSQPELASGWEGALDGDWTTRIVRIPKNNYLMPAINYAIELALQTPSRNPKRDVVLVTDNDIVWPRGSIAQLLGNLASGEADVACAAYHFDGREDIQNSVVRDYGWTPCDAALDRYEAWANERSGTGVVEGFNSSCFATWGEVWRRVGPFDEVFKFVCNDVDWRWRAILLGVRIGIFLNNPIFHKQAATRMIGMADKYNHDDMMECCAKWSCTWDEITLGDPPSVLLSSGGLLTRTLRRNHKAFRRVKTYRVAQKPARRDARPAAVAVPPSPRPRVERFRGGRVLPPLGSSNRKNPPPPPPVGVRAGTPAARSRTIPRSRQYDLIVHGYWDPCDGYGSLNHNLAIELKRLGIDVAFVPMLEAADARAHSSEEFLRLVDRDARSSLCMSIMAPDNARLPIQHYVTPGKHVIYTMFESTTLPTGWSTNCNMYDAVWTPDDFCTDLFQRNGVFVPTETVCFGLPTQPWPFIERDVANESGRPFRFLLYANADWNNVRKNYQLTFDAFRDAFGDREDVELTIKTNGDYPDEVRRCKNVRVVSGRFTREQLLGMLRDADCFLYPSNGEGFGLPPREAMLTGLPVVVSDWSALSKLVRVPGLCYSIPVRELQIWDHQRWPGYVGQHAKIRREDFAQALVDVFSDQRRARAVGEFASRWVRENEDIVAGARLVADKLKQLR